MPGIGETFVASLTHRHRGHIREVITVVTQQLGDTVWKMKGNTYFNYMGDFILKDLIPSIIDEGGDLTGAQTDER